MRNCSKNTGSQSVRASQTAIFSRKNIRLYREFSLWPLVKRTECSSSDYPLTTIRVIVWSRSKLAGIWTPQILTTTPVAMYSSPIHILFSVFFTPNSSSVLYFCLLLSILLLRISAAAWEQQNPPECSPC